MTTDEFSSWLQNELNQRGWTKAELARRSGISPSQISRAMNGERGLGEQTINALAHALKLPPEEVFRAAGLLPPVQPKHAQINELDHLAYLLGEEDLQEVIDYAKMRLKKTEEKVIYKQRSSRRIKPPARSAIKE